MRKSLAVILIIAAIVPALLMPVAKIANGQEPTQVIDLTGITPTNAAIVVIVAGFGGLIRILIPFLRKAKDRAQQIEAAQEQGQTTKLKPLKFQYSYLYSWFIALPIASVDAIAWALSLGVATDPFGLVISAFHAGLTMTWFVTEAQT